MTQTLNGRTAEYEVDPIFLQRWSPRAFTGEAMPHEDLLRLFEAAHWAPSGNSTAVLAMLSSVSSPALPLRTWATAWVSSSLE